MRTPEPKVMGVIHDTLVDGLPWRRDMAKFDLKMTPDDLRSTPLLMSRVDLNMPFDKQLS